MSGVTASLSSPGRALLPLPPVHLKAVAGVDGGIDLDWIRQSREGWAWLDGVEVPLGEDSELYRVTITGAPSGTVIAFEVTTTQLRIEATQLAGLRAAGDAHLHIAVSQVGRFGVSAVAETVILV